MGGGLDAFPALEAFNTAFRGGAVEGPATAGFLVHSGDKEIFFCFPRGGPELMAGGFPLVVQ